MSKMALADCSGVDDAVIAKTPRANHSVTAESFEDRNSRDRRNTSRTAGHPSQMSPANCTDIVGRANAALFDAEGL
jgi:hypothetical protein